MSNINLYGQALDPDELRRRIGRLEEVAGIESFIYDDGPERGVRALRVRTGTGFAFTVLADRGMLTRRITARVGESILRLDDTIENLGWSSAPLMLLYHINVGWPLLSEFSRLSGPGAPGVPPEPHESFPRNTGAWDRFAGPTRAFQERSDYHRPIPDKEGWAEVLLENASVPGGVALRVRFRPDELPEFVQWTMTAEGTYVLGLEPSTCRLRGFQAENDAGRIIHLAPGEKRRFSVEIGIEAGPH